MTQQTHVSTGERYILHLLSFTLLGFDIHVSKGDRSISEFLHPPWFRQGQGHFPINYRLLKA